jgi:hypothetical protein
VLKTLKSVKLVIDVLTDPVKVVFTTAFLSILMQQQQKQKAELSFGRIFEQTEVIGIYSWVSDYFIPLCHLQWLHPIEWEHTNDMSGQGSEMWLS